MEALPLLGQGSIKDPSGIQLLLRESRNDHSAHQRCRSNNIWLSHQLMHWLHHGQRIGVLTDNPQKYQQPMQTLTASLKVATSASNQLRFLTTTPPTLAKQLQRLCATPIDVLILDYHLFYGYTKLLRPGVGSSMPLTPLPYRSAYQTISNHFQGITVLNDDQPLSLGKTPAVVQHNSDAILETRWVTQQQQMHLQVSYHKLRRDTVDDNIGQWYQYAWDGTTCCLDGLTAPQTMSGWSVDISTETISPPLVPLQQQLWGQRQTAQNSASFSS